MIRSVFAATIAAALLAGPAIALAQTDMVTYGDTLRKKSSARSAVQPVKHGSTTTKHGSAGRKRAAAVKSHPASKAHSRR